ncbi:hypothetical protein ABIB50_002778 [Mucilaginibacter sp. UYCu711]
MLTLYDFNEDEQARAVWDGTFLSHQFEAELTVQLYLVRSFYLL